MPRRSNPALPNIHASMPARTPLASLLKLRQKDPEFVRMRRLGAVFEQFHLKYTTTSAVSGRRTVINGKQVINFGSANYLGLEQHPDVIAASKRALDELGTHAGCSRVFSSHENIVLLEQELSALVGAERTLIGHNISQIHAGVLPALFSDHDSVLFLDRYAHTSMHQAALIAKAKGARVVRVDVSDLPGLKAIIKKERPKRGALLVDGVYSMQGHTPELAKLDKICRSNKVLLYVDDAHGVGVLGKHGGGVMEVHGLSYENILLVGSLQKAFGTYGGFISGCEAVIDFLRVTSKAYIFSGTLQPSAVEGARASVRIARSHEGAALRKRVAAISRKVRHELATLGYSVPEGESPIVPVLIGADVQTLMAGRKLYDLGIYLNSVLFPAVPKGQGILRISLTSLHADEDIEALLRAFQELKTYLKNYDQPLRGAAHVAIEVARSKLKKESYAL